MKILAIGAILTVWLMLGGVLALLLMEKPIPEWFSHLTAASASAVLTAIVTKRIVAAK